MTKRVFELVPKSGEPDDDIVSVCKKLLEMAEAGELRAVAVAIDTTDGSTGHTLACADRVNLPNIYMAVGMLRRRLESVGHDNEERG